MSDLSVTIGLAVLVIVAVCALIYAVYRHNRRRDAEAASWPGVPGRISTSRVVEQRAAGGNDGSTVTRTIVPEVVYSYSVNGTAYTGRRIRFGLVTRTRKAAEAVCARYPQGADVTVRYNPAKPKDSVLEHGEPAKAASPEPGTPMPG